MGYKKYARFSKAAYDAADPVAKDILVKLLNGQGIFAKAEEKQDADVKALVPVFHEGEIKPGWQGDWPKAFKTVDIPYRKHRLLEEHKGFDLYFWVISGDLKNAWKIPAEELTEDRVEKKDTTRMKNEKFFRIPLNKCELVSLEEII
jgi:hypothetical protein